MTEWHWTEMWIHHYWCNECNECSSRWDGNEWNGMNRCIKGSLSTSLWILPDHKLVPLSLSLSHGRLWWFYSISRLISSSTSFLFIALHLSPSCLTILSATSSSFSSVSLTLSSYPYPSYITSSPLSLFAICSPHHGECRKGGTTRSSKKWVPVHFLSSFASFLSQPITVSHIFFFTVFTVPISAIFPLCLSSFSIFSLVQFFFLLHTIHQIKNGFMIWYRIKRERLSTLLLSLILRYSSQDVSVQFPPYSIPSSSFLHTPPSTSHFSFGSLVCILPSISQIYSSLLLYISFTSLSPSENTQKVMEEAQDHKVFVTKEKDLLHLMTFPIFSSLLCRRTGMGEKFSQILKWHAKAAWRIKILT